MSTVGDKRSEDDYELESSIDDGIETIVHMEPTKTEQNRVLRKLDIVIMPLMATAVLCMWKAEYYLHQYKCLTRLLQIWLYL